MTAECYFPTEPLKQSGRDHDSVTVVQDAAGRRLTKSFRRVGDRIVKGSYPNASEFRAFEVEVDDIASLAKMLDAVAADGHAALIRGAPGRFYPRNGSPAFRLLQPQEGLASAKTGARISQHQIRLRNLQPDEEHRYAVIDRMNEALGWLMWLEPEERQLVWLRVEGLPWKWITRRLGIGRTTAWQRWSTALLKIVVRLDTAEQIRPDIKALNNLARSVLERG